MKKRLLTLLTSAVGIVALSACAGNLKDLGTNVESFNFPGTGYIENDYFALKSLSYDLKVGESKAIEIETFPSSYKEEQLTFVSEDPSIVSVSEKGVLTANKLGFTNVTVSSKDGSVSSIVRAVVTGTSDEAEETKKSIVEKYNSTDYSSPTRFVRYEYSEEFYSCEGVLDHGSKSLEAMYYDSEAGYFAVDGPYVTYKVPGGQPEVSDGKWIFYTINDGLYVRMIHITSSTKNYFDLNTSSYLTYDDAVRAVLNILFVSGEKIVNDAMEAYDGKEDFQSFASYSGTKIYGVDDKSVYVTYDEANSGEVVEADDEINYYDIPAGTIYSYVYHEEFLNSDCRTKNLIVDMTMSYKRDGKNWTRTFNRNQLFEEDFEIVKVQNPKDNGYKLVDSVYDL